jgi:hypothetical protein
MVRKSIKRRSADKARQAMQKHIERMACKGWICFREFEGDNYLDFECIAWFCRSDEI